jgi:hypothetical protein
MSRPSDDFINVEYGAFDYEASDRLIARINKCLEAAPPDSIEAICADIASGALGRFEQLDPAVALGDCLP